MPSGLDREAAYAVLSQAVARVSVDESVYEVLGIGPDGPVGPAVILVVQAIDVGAVLSLLNTIHPKSAGAYIDHGEDGEPPDDDGEPDTLAFVPGPDKGA